MIRSRWADAAGLPVTIRPPFELLRERRDVALDVAGITHIDRAQFDAERRRHGLDRAELTRPGRDRGFAKDRRPREVRRESL